MTATTTPAAMIATMAAVPAAAVAAVLPAVAAAQLEAEVRDQAAAVGPKVAVERTPSLDNPGKTRNDTF